MLSLPKAICRLKEHSVSDIKNTAKTFNRDKPIVNHVLTHKEHKAKLLPQILEVVKKDPDSERTTVYRRQRETHWIFTLRTLAPEGLNTSS